MKKSITNQRAALHKKPLALARETLRLLSTAELDWAGGRLNTSDNGACQSIPMAAMCHPTVQD